MKSHPKEAQNKKYFGKPMGAEMKSHPKAVGLFKPAKAQVNMVKKGMAGNPALPGMKAAYHGATHALTKKAHYKTSKLASAASKIMPAASALSYNPIASLKTRK